MFDNVLPVGWVIKATQVGLQLAAEDLESSALANTVGADETEDVAGAGHGQAVELEAVGRVAVGDLGLEVGGQVDDGNGAEGAFLGADAAADAERLRDEGEARLGRHLDAELTAADDGARLFAFLTAFLARDRVRFELTRSRYRALAVRETRSGVRRTFGLHCRHGSWSATSWVAMAG